MSDHIRVVRVRKAQKPNRVGVRELKTHAARILRQVRDSHASYVVTHRGKAVGMILPIDESDGTSATQERNDAAAAAWETFMQAGRRLEHRFTAGVSGVELLSSSRR
jgi:prevent-host-death family protein